LIFHPHSIATYQNTVTLVVSISGGPTLVTNQHFGGKELGSKGWLVHPRSGRFVMSEPYLHISSLAFASESTVRRFDATTLHGVIPGAGHSKDVHSRRITFMCAFWRDIKFRTPNVW
jgi:hypothetical protein